jgi:hypothetical protein
MGASMGAGGAGQLGFLAPELFDVIGMLGIPIVDWTFMLRTISRSYLGGFCHRERILAHLDRINDPRGPAFCGPVKGVEKLEPSGRILEPDQDFNHFYQGAQMGRGGTFGRNTFRASFKDIALAFGNPLSYNPSSPYLPPGVTREWLEQSDAYRCAHPVVLKNFKNKEYNPDGRYDVITVCDTETDAGDFNPARPSEAPFETLLAVDYNGNGVRDYGEPLVLELSERYRDVGLDPEDRYDPFTHPTGRAGNWLYDQGEPFDDFGLDGIPDTGDYGEGNGKFDYNPNVENYFAQNPRHLIESLPREQLERLNIWADAGIRDFLVSSGGMNWLWGALQARVGRDIARDYTSFSSLLPGASDYDFLEVDYSSSTLGRHAYLRYGDPAASETQIEQGDGNHVGTADQILNRLLTAMTFAQSRFRTRDMRAVFDSKDVTEALLNRSYYSESLGEERGYGIVLPPGYDDPLNRDERYPVIYFLHGQGMEFREFLASGLLYYGYMAGSARPETKRRRESDWAKFLLVFPDSLCRHGECDQGTFNANFVGLDGHGPRFEDSLFELIAHVDKTYRVLPPVEVEEHR